MLFCETQWRHSAKRRLYNNPPPHFIVLDGSVKTEEVEVIEFHRIVFNLDEHIAAYLMPISHNRIAVTRPVPSCNAVQICNELLQIGTHI